MSEAATLTRTAQQTEHFDVLIVGAGIAGVGGAYHMAKERPGSSFVFQGRKMVSLVFEAVPEARYGLLAPVFDRFPYALLRAHDRPHTLTEEKQA